MLPTEPGQNDLFPIFPTRGPTNTSHVMFADGKLHMTVEDGGIPTMFASVTAAGLQVLGNALDREPLLQALIGGWLRGKTPNIRDLAPELAHGTEDERSPTSSGSTPWAPTRPTAASTGPLTVQPTLTIVALALKSAAAMRNAPQ